MIKCFRTGAKWPKQPWSDVSTLSQVVRILDPVMRRDQNWPVLIEETAEHSHLENNAKFIWFRWFQKLVLIWLNIPILLPFSCLPKDRGQEQLEYLEATGKYLLWMLVRSSYRHLSLAFKALLSSFSANPVCTDDLTLLVRTASFLCACEDHGQCLLSY